MAGDMHACSRYGTLTQAPALAVWLERSCGQGIGLRSVWPATGMLTSLLEAERSPARWLHLLPLDGAAEPTPDPNPFCSGAAADAAQPGGGPPGAPSSSLRGQGSAGAGAGPAPACAPQRSIVAALAAPELRCRASWFRELLGAAGAPGAAAEPVQAPARALLLQSLVEALEARLRPDTPACSAAPGQQARQSVAQLCDAKREWEGVA